MDPNATLNQIREALKAMGNPDGDAAWYKDHAEHIDILIEKVSIMDHWLTNKKKGGQGGYLPDDWD